MMVAAGEDGVKSLEDFAGYAVDDLVGWREKKDGEVKTFVGVFSKFGITRPEAEEMVVGARTMMGWMTEAETVEAEAEA